MHRALTTLSAVAVLALPPAQALAALEKPKPRVVVTTKRFTGPAADVDRWGDLVVTISVRKTTTINGTKRTVVRRIMGIYIPTFPDHTDRSIFINQHALPTLKSEALTAQSARIDLVSGATETSDAFVQSLQAAILQAQNA